jgi:hypothetical protein
MGCADPCVCSRFSEKSVVVCDQFFKSAASADLVERLIDDHAYGGVASECSDVLAVLLNEFGVLSSAGAR